MFRKLKDLVSNPQSTREPSQLSNAPTAEAANIGLRSWWTAEFSEAERAYILNKYQPMVMGVDGDPTDDAHKIIGADGTLSIPLTTLATWFMSPKDDLPLAMRLLGKGIEVGEENQGTILDQHYTLLNLIRVYYRNRSNDAVSFELAIEACEKQIALAPLAAEMFMCQEWVKALPEHTGFEQLAIIREREKDYDEAIRLSSEALRQGWAGDWEKRIARCEKRKLSSH